MSGRIRFGGLCDGWCLRVWFLVSKDGVVDSGWIGFVMRYVFVMMRIWLVKKKRRKKSVSVKCR